MPHKARKLLIDISLACEETMEFCRGMDLQAFKDDRKTQLAVERQFEIIGDALVRLERIEPETLARWIPEYRRIIGFRNLVAHGYDIIDDDVLYDLAQNHVPGLLEKARSYPSLE